MEFKLKLDLTEWKDIKPTNLNYDYILQHCDGLGPKAEFLKQTCYDQFITIPLASENQTSDPVEPDFFKHNAEMEVPILYLGMEWQTHKGWVVPLQQETDNTMKAFSNIFSLPKKNGGIRLVFTAENINRFVFRDLSFPLPDATTVLRHNFAWMAKIDLSHAFMHFDLSPTLQSYCGVQILEKKWKYLKMPWGTAFGPYVLQTFTEAIAQYVQELTDCRVVVYMDDFVIVGLHREQVQKALQTLTLMLQFAGFTINTQKSTQVPTQEIEWLGFLLRPNSLALNPEKITVRDELFQKICKGAIFQDVVAYLGQAAHEAKVAKGLATPIKHLQASLPSTYVQSTDRKHRFARCKLTAEFRAMLTKIHKSLRLPSIQYKPQIFSKTYEVCTDASFDPFTLKGQAGISNRDGTSRHTILFEGKFFKKFGIDLKVCRIHHLELFAICCAVRMAPRNCNLRIWADSTTCIFQTAKGGAFDTVQNSMIVWLYSQIEKANITLTIQYVNTLNNMADYPSRQLIDVIQPRARENCDPLVMSKLYNEAPLPMTKDEAVDFWSRLFRIVLPDYTIRQWQAKLIAHTDRFDLLIRNIEEIEKDIFLYPSELQAAIAAAFVKWAYLLQPDTLSPLHLSLANKLFTLGFVRQNTIWNAAQRKIQRRFVFNSNVAFGPATTQFDDLYLEDVQPLQFDNTGRLILSVRKKLTEESQVRNKAFILLPDLQFKKYGNNILDQWEIVPIDKRPSYDRHLLVKEMQQRLSMPVLPDRFKEWGTPYKALQTLPVVDQDDASTADESDDQLDYQAPEIHTDFYGNKPPELGVDWTPTLRDQGQAGVSLEKKVLPTWGRNTRNRFESLEKFNPNKSITNSEVNHKQKSGTSKTQQKSRFAIL